MRSIRALAAVLTMLAVVACTSAPPGWTYAPAPSATPLPSVVPGDSGAAPSGSVAPSESAAPGAIELTALNIAFDKSELTVPAATPFQIVFHNQDASIQHNVAIHEGSATGPEVFRGEIFAGVATKTYDVPAIAAGTYGFVCTVHPNMTGTLTAE
ncbi:MAG: cupredoxin domain-containing protein [Candidatus Limnocylindrales bacterium]